MLMVTISLLRGNLQDLPTAEPFVVTGAWVSTGLSVMAKYDMLGTVIGDVLYYGMGHNGPGNNGAWESVNLKTGARKSLASFPVGTGVADPAVFVIGNDIYCGGGTYYDAGWHRSNRFYKYTIAANKWDEISPYPETYITSSMAALPSAMKVLWVWDILQMAMLPRLVESFINTPPILQAARGRPLLIMEIMEP